MDASLDTLIWGHGRHTEAFLQKYMESMRFSGLEIPRGTKLWIHDEHFLATADLSYKVGVPRDFFRGFAPIVHGDRAITSHMAWMVQAKGHWLRLLTKVASRSEPGLP
jgi:hypothetical protein